MSTTTTKKLVDRLHGAGLNLSVTKDGGLAVKPSDRLTDDLRDLIRGNKAALVDWLMTDQELTAEARLIEYRLFTRLAPPPKPEPEPEPQPAPEPPTDPQAWRELAQAYNAHHFSCKTCCAAGQGRGLRCGTGSSLWVNYQSSI